MVTKRQAINGIMMFMDKHMIPQAEGNYKIILRTAKAGMAVAPDKFWEIIKNNALVSMTGAIDASDHVDMELFARILTEGFGSDEFCLSLKFLGEEYKIYLSSDDVRALKSYMERA